MEAFKGADCIWNRNKQPDAEIDLELEEDEWPLLLICHHPVLESLVHVSFINHFEPFLCNTTCID